MPRKEGRTRASGILHPLGEARQRLTLRARSVGSLERFIADVRHGESAQNSGERSGACPRWQLELSSSSGTPEMVRASAASVAAEVPTPRVDVFTEKEEV